MITIMRTIINAIPKELYAIFVLILGTAFGLTLLLYSNSLENIEEQAKTIQQMEISIESASKVLSDEVVAKQGLSNQLLECQTSSIKLSKQLEANRKLIEDSKTENINEELIVEKSTIIRAGSILSAPIPSY